MVTWFSLYHKAFIKTRTYSWLRLHSVYRSPITPTTTFFVIWIPLAAEDIRPLIADEQRSTLDKGNPRKAHLAEKAFDENPWTVLFREDLERVLKSGLFVEKKYAITSALV